MKIESTKIIITLSVPEAIKLRQLIMRGSQFYSEEKPPFGLNSFYKQFGVSKEKAKEWMEFYENFIPLLDIEIYQKETCREDGPDGN